MPEMSGTDLQDTAPGEAAEMLSLLGALLAFGPIRSSRRQQGLLRHLVTEEIAGRGDRLNAYAIAFDVYDRSSDFDPKIDSIVRVEMHRLRQSLEAWRNDPGNHAERALILEPRQYRPAIVSRSEKAVIQPAAVPWYRRNPLPIPVGLVLIGVVAASSLLLYRTEFTGRCASLRPKVFLPSAVAGPIDAELNKLLIERFDRFMNYYTLVNAVKRSDDGCDGAPSFRVSITFDRDNADKKQNLLHVEATDMQSDKTIWTNAYPVSNSMSEQQLNILVASIAYSLSYDHGAIPTAATRSNWNDGDSLSEYKCLMSAYQYYSSIPPPGAWADTRACLIKFFRTSTQADISGFLGSIELEPRYEPKLLKQRDHDYYEEAVARGKELDPRNLDLLIAELRHSRTTPTIDLTMINSITTTMQDNYQYQPEAAYQLSYVQSAILAQYGDAIENNKISSAISPGEFEPNLARIYILLKDGSADDLKQYIPQLSIDFYIVSKLIVLYYADSVNDDTLRKNTLKGIQESLCSTRKCMVEELTSGQFHPDIYRPLMTTVDRHFPAARSGAVAAAAIPASMP